MQIKTLTLKNFRGFKDTEITFSEGLTVLVGVNGAGKSSVLDALAMMLSWAVARIRSENGSGRRMTKADIRNGESDASATVRIEYDGAEYEWRLVGWTPGVKSHSRSDWAGLATFADLIRENLTRMQVVEEAYFSPFALPVMVHYSVHRAVTSVPVGVPNKWTSFDQLEVYEAALPGSSSFQSFFEWFRAREDYENEIQARMHRQAASENRPETLAESLLSVDRDMQVVRGAMHALNPAFDRFEIRRKDDSMVAEKNGEKIRIDQLSDGEKCSIALAGDLARRLSLANPGKLDPFQGYGVVLIDEIEQHLHPKWQREIIGNLQRTFPNVQFIVSTHSPQVLGDVEHDDIRCFYPDPEKGQQVYVPQRSLGLDSNSILEEVFNAGRRDAGVAEKLEKIFELIALESFDSAEEYIAALEVELGSDIPDLIKAKTMIAMLEGSGAEHS